MSKKTLSNKPRPAVYDLKDLPAPYRKIWQTARPLLEAGRPGDTTHAWETAQLVLNYRGRLKFDRDVLVPVALMHDIGHYAILPEHFKFVTGPEKIKNGKLVHMLAGAKIARDILTAVHYPAGKIQEILDIISIHDADQLDEVDLKKVYNTANKKIFHDLDSLDRYTETRVQSFRKIYKPAALVKLLAAMSDSFFYSEFKDLAKRRLQALLK